MVEFGKHFWEGQGKVQVLSASLDGRVDLGESGVSSKVRKEHGSELAIPVPRSPGP